MVHGLNDWNVKPRNVYNLYNALQKLPVVSKLVLHQGQHIYVNNFQSLDFTDMMNLWLSHKLYGLENGAEKLLPNVLVQDNVKESTWHAKDAWIDEDADEVVLKATPCGKLKPLSAEKCSADGHDGNCHDKELQFKDSLDQKISKHTSATLQNGNTIWLPKRRRLIRTASCGRALHLTKTSFLKEHQKFP